KDGAAMRGSSSSKVVGAGCVDISSPVTVRQQGSTGTTALLLASRAQHGWSQSSTQHDAAAARMPISGINATSIKAAARTRRLRRMELPIVEQFAERRYLRYWLAVALRFSRA